MAQAIATALGVKELPQRSLVDLLTERVRDAELLLVLEDCQHLLGSVAGMAARLLSACPDSALRQVSRFGYVELVSSQNRVYGYGPGALFVVGTARRNMFFRQLLGFTTDPASATPSFPGKRSSSESPGSQR